MRIALVLLVLLLGGCAGAYHTSSDGRLETRIDDSYKARDACRLAKKLSAECEVVLLGSIATNKYVEILERSLGDRLLFPAEFVGRGDMSRGGLLLRAVEAGEELAYRPVRGAERHGARPPKLPPKKRA